MSLKRFQYVIEEAKDVKKQSVVSSIEAISSHSESSQPHSRLNELFSSFGLSATTSTSCFTASLPIVSSVPRTVEIIWDGYMAPGFTLKLKRTGAILVSNVTCKTQMATSLQVGSELKLVGGFPVKRLRLQDVKKVMLLAPKPVSLVFIKADHVMDMPKLTSEPQLLCVMSSTVDRPLTSTMACPTLQCSEDTSETKDNANSSMMSSAFYSKPSENNKSKKRKVSKLQIALVRVNQLLNRPVRQAGLQIAIDKSIVV